LFGSFTERARWVVVQAQEEARMRNYNFVGSEHILLGLIREGDGVAARTLESLGIGLDGVLRQVEEIIGPGRYAPAGPIPFTPRAKRVVELALTEAVLLGQDRVGTEHILLSLISEGDGVGAMVLVRLGADVDLVREQVMQLSGGWQQP
jgi:ATP-dependent Clp protease ATP-binding subunit ClpC